jgi:Spy/CpxP family protein refolding chaperone
MKARAFIFILVLSLSINGAVLGTLAYRHYRNTALVSPQPTSEPCPVSPGDHHLYQDLKLSSQQLAQMAPLAQNFHSQLGKLSASMEEKKENLVDLLSQKDVDPEKITALRREMSTIQDEIQKEVVEHILATRKILNAQQQQRFFDLMRRSMRSKMPWMAQEKP